MYTLFFSEVHLQLCDSLLTGRTGTGNLDQVSGVDLSQVGGILGFTNGLVRSRARELDLSTGLVLEVSKVLTTTSDEETMLRSRDLDTKNDPVAQSSDGLLQLSLELGNEFRLSAETNFVGGFALTRAVD